jgi:membrane-bound metal-dependent hydrolase YbcI (DUF457 family)
MMARTHFVTGCTAGAAVGSAALAVGVPPTHAVVAVGVTAYAALLPDLDHPRATVTYSIGPVTMLLSWLLRLFVEHRGATHRPERAPWWALPVALPTVWAPGVLGGWSALLWWVAVTVGWLTHLWGDARTLSGIPWSGPWVRRWWGRTNGGRLRIGQVFRTGSPREDYLLRRRYGPAAALALVGFALLVEAVVR